MSADDERALRDRFSDVLLRLTRATDHLARQLENGLAVGKEPDAVDGSTWGKESPAALLNILTRTVKSLAQMADELEEGVSEADAALSLSDRERVLRINALLARLQDRVGHDKGTPDEADDGGAAGEAAGGSE